MMRNLMSRPTFGSLFSGIGGFDAGLEAAGWACAFQVEVDPFCTKVLERHWPHVPRHRDIRGVTPTDLAAVDLLCGGFPCQDLSVAGRRAGLAGARSGLFFEFVRVATELRPRWLLLENVPGLLSSNGGRDFAVVLAALGDAGYGVGWRVLDSRWFGVPQRRRRVFLVGHLGGPCPIEVLFEPEGVLGDLAASGAEGEDVAWGTADGVGGGSELGYALTARGRKGGDPSTDTYIPSQQVSPPLMAEGFDASEDGRGRKVFAFNRLQDPVSSPSVGTTLGTNEHALAFALRKDPGGIGQGHNTNFVPAAVRRLTPTECERLQAFPDGWTCLCGVEPYSTADCRCPDGPRYAALGNAVTTSVVAWLGRRIMSVYGTYGA